MRHLQLLFCIFAVWLPIKAQNSKPDLIIINARIHTVDQANPKAEALAILGNKFVAVGSNDGIRVLAGAETKVIDASGKLVLPGFNDAHVHFTAIGNQFSGIDLRFAKSSYEVVKKLAFYARFLPKGRWVLGGQWNDKTWLPSSLPAKEMIDPVTPVNPVFLYDRDAKMALANSAALKIAGVSKDTFRDLTGISRYSTGEPTGILTGNAIALVRGFVPRFQTSNWYEVLETSTNYAAAMGVTSVQDMHSDYLTELLSKLLADGKLKTRVYDCTPLSDWKKLEDAGIKRANGSGMIRRGCLKSQIDSGEGTTQQLHDEISRADKAGLQVMIHAIGNEPINNVLNVFEQVEKENGSKDRRFRVEHAFRFGISDLNRFADLKIIPSLQPHLFNGRDPYRSILNSKAQVAFGSDASITNFNPMFGIADAVNSASENERLTVEEAVQIYTIGSAYAEFQDDQKGSITVGKLADLVLLSEDIFAIDPYKIVETRVLLTMVDGKIVYQEK